MAVEKHISVFFLLPVFVIAASCRQPATARPERADSQPGGGTPAVSAGSAPAAADSLAAAAGKEANSSFEAVSQNVPTGWTSTRVDGETGWVTTEKLARTGQKAVVLRGRGKEAGARLFSSPIAVRPGDAVEFMVWVRPEGQAVHSPAAYVEGRTGKGWEAIEPVASGAMLRTSKYRIHFEWTPRGYTVFVPGGVLEVRAVLSCTAAESADVSWYADDFTYRVVSYSSYLDAQPDKSLPDICLLGVDTLSQTALGCYGGERVHTPNIDLLAREGFQFTYVTPTAPWTKPSFASILTSLYPSQHGAQLINSQLPDDVTTLAEVLRDNGYFTVGFARAPYDGFIGPGMNFNQGFDIYFHADNDQLVFEAVKQFLDTNVENLQRKRGGLFLFWHLFEPHTPFVNHNPSFVKNKGKGGDTFNDGLADIHVLDNQEMYNEHDRRYIRACYDSEAGLVDTQLGELFRRLKCLGLYDGSHIVLCADHGESFGEKPGVWNHAHPYITCLQTPLIFRLPGGAKDSTVDTGSLVSNLDIMPTILAVAGAPAPEECEGRNLFGGADGPTAHYGISEHKALLTGGSLVVRERRYRLVANNATRWEAPEDWTSARWTLYGPDSTVRYELYDLENDPFELNDIAAQEPEIVARLRKVLDDHAARTGISGDKPARTGPTQEMLQDTLEQLKAIGYN